MKTPDADPRKAEAELVAKICNGDTTALEHLYLCYVDRLYSLVFYQIGKNKNVAEGIVQDTFMAALSSIGQFRGQSSFFTWLCSIAQHKITDFHHSKAQEPTLDIQPVSTGAIGRKQIRDIEQLATDKIESEEAQNVIEQALSNLPLDDRQVLIFKYVEQMPVHEISQVMHRSPKSVEVLLTRARKAFQNNLSHLT